MKNKLRQERSLLLSCIIGETAAFCFALLFRYVVMAPYYPNPARDFDFYKMYLVVVLAFYSVIFFHRQKKRPAVWEMNGYENLIEVFKQHIMLSICLITFLYFIHSSQKISRTVMGLLILFGVSLDLLIRYFYRKLHSRRLSMEKKEQQVLLLAMEGEIDRLSWTIEHYGYNNPNKAKHTNCKIKDTVSISDKITPEKQLEKLHSEGCDMIYLSAKAAGFLGHNAVKQLEHLDTPICLELTAAGISIDAAEVIEEGGSAAICMSLLTHKCHVLNVEYIATTIADAASYLINHTKELSGKYICFSNVHTTVMAADDKDYRAILNNSAATFPDGKPVADKIMTQGYGEAERVAGPDLMAELFRRSEGTGLKHYFYGSTEETLDSLKKNLKENYPYMDIAGMYSPPFRELTPEEDSDMVKLINASGADFVWIGLGAPKQEKWMAEHKDRINGVMLGVGAGFDFHAGTVKRAPRVLQRLGLEWLYRLCQNPKRLLKRYLVTNTKFILYTAFRKG